MTICRPESPAFASTAEHTVWRALRSQLDGSSVLLANVRVTDREMDREADLIAVIPDAGIVVIEVKGGSVWREGQQWWQATPEGDKRIDPVGQAIGAQYAIRKYVEKDPRWRGASAQRVRWAHGIALPSTHLPMDFATPELPRSLALDRSQHDTIGADVRSIVTGQRNDYPSPTMPSSRGRRHGR